MRTLPTQLTIDGQEVPLSALDWLILLSVSRAAEYLGVSPATVRRWTDEERFPHLRTPGGQRRYRLADLEAFAESRKA